MTENDLGVLSTSEESDFDGSQNTSFETPVRYRPKQLKNFTPRQRPRFPHTTCSYSSEEDEGPPRSRKRPEFGQPKTSCTSRSTPRSLAGDAVPLGEATNRPAKTTRTPNHSVNENSQGGTQLIGIENALLETNQLLKHVIKRVDKCEKQIKSFESKFDEVTTCSSSTSAVSTPSRKKAIIPEEVRHETRRVYYMLLDEDHNFTGWNCTPGVTFKSAENQHIVNQLVTEVKGLNGNFLTQHIRDAAYRFYRSQREEQSLKRRGKSDIKHKQKRRHERKLRKLEECSASLRKVMFADAKDREKWEKIMNLEFISSEDSGLNDGNEVLIVRPLPWCSTRVDHMFNDLDKKSLNDKSPLAKHQMKRRVLGQLSQRPKSAFEGLPQWVFSS